MKPNEKRIAKRNACEASAVCSYILRRFRRGRANDWVKVMKESIKSNAAKFSALRMVKAYVDKFYKKALKAYKNNTETNHASSYTLSAVKSNHPGNADIE